MTNDVFLCCHQPRQPIDHPGLPPSDEGGAVDVPRVPLEIEPSLPILHVLESPPRHASGRLEGIRLESGEDCECYQSLGRAVDVNRVNAVMKVLRGPVGQEEALPVEGVASTQ